MRERCGNCTYYDKPKKWCRWGPIPEDQPFTHHCSNYWDGKANLRADRALDLKKLKKLVGALSDAEVKQRAALFELSQYIEYGEDKK
jgi:hypothetical protein